MVTHDVQEALLLADRVLVMAGGRLLADATPAELLKGHADPAVAALIDTPARQARALSALMGAGA
jgi:osmoprotectant transport system ATP-binding protein